MLAELRTVLIGDSDLSALISNRVDPFNLSEGGVDALPAVFYTVDDEAALQAMTKQSMKLAQVNYTAFSTTLAEAENVADKVQAALDDYSETDDGIIHVRCIERDRDTVEPIDGSENYFYSTTLLFQVWHTT